MPFGKLRFNISQVLLRSVLVRRKFFTIQFDPSHTGGITHMAVRPLVTTGIALASAGLLIATAPTVVAPLTQKDIKVVADTQVTLAATQLQQILDAYLTGLVVNDNPLDPAKLDNNGLLGVLQLLTGGEDFPDLPLANTYITGGLLGVVGGLPVVAGSPLLDAYINGGPTADSPNGLIGVLDELTQGDQFANAYVLGGLVGLANEVIPENTLASVYLNGGVVGVVGALPVVQNSDLLNAYVNGGPTGGDTPNGLIGVLDELTAVGGDFESPLANAYVLGGLGGVAAAVIPANTLTAAYVVGYPNEGPNGLLGATQFVVDNILGNPVPEEPEEETLMKVAGGETETTDPGTKSGLPKWEPKLPKFSPLVEKAPAAPELPGPIDLPEPTITKLVEKTDKGEQKPLVRDSLKFTPGGGDVILPFAGGGGADKEWNGKKFVKQLKDAFGGGKGESSSEGGDSE
ncbi:MAG: hypothetical protein JST91_02590 [Actinobacteria bacterium]|nr:hypothetical protein [Actinomycetota bacterium]